MNIFELITGKKYPVEDVYVGDIGVVGLNAGGTILDAYPVEKRALFLRTEEGYVLISHVKNISNSISHITKIGGAFQEIKDGEDFRETSFITNHVPYLSSYVGADLPEKANVRQLKKTGKAAPVVHYSWNYKLKQVVKYLFFC